MTEQQPPPRGMSPKIAMRRQAWRKGELQREGPAGAKIRIQRDPTEDLTFGDDDSPIVAWTTPPGGGLNHGWYIYLPNDGGSGNLGGRETDSNEDVRAMARAYLINLRARQNAVIDRWLA